MKDINFFLQEYEVRGHKIPSRFFFAPINTGYANNGEPTMRLIDFHTLRSGKRIGISYVGNVAIGKRFVTNDNTLFFNCEDEKWIKLTQSIKNNGSVPGIQLGCRYSKIKPLKSFKAENVEKYLQDARAELSLTSKDEIKMIEEGFVQSAIKAYNVGFEVIQIHAAHGYFLSLLISNNFNIREDEYGVNRTLLLENIITRIRKNLPNVILDVRISLLEGLDSIKSEIEYKKEVIKDICKLDIDIVSISNGIYNVNKELIYPPLGWGNGVYIDKVLPFSKEYPNKLWNISGNIWDLNSIIKSIPNNVTFSIGRSLIADSEFVSKTYEGNIESINKCIRCNSCHYYSFGKANIECRINN